MTHHFLGSPHSRSAVNAPLKQFISQFNVRDYECDMQGHVNNGVYFNYFEHARHEFLNEMQLSLKSLVDKGIHLVATRVEIDYKRPLKSRDQFYIETMFEQVSRIQYRFVQSLYKAEHLFALASVYAVAIDHLGKPIRLKSLDQLK